MNRKFLGVALGVALFVGGGVSLIRMRAGVEAEEEREATRVKTEALGRELMVACDRDFSLVKKIRETGLGSMTRPSMTRAEFISALRGALFQATSCLRGAHKKLSAAAPPDFKFVGDRSGASLLLARLARTSAELDLLLPFDPEQEHWFFSSTHLYFKTPEKLRAYEFAYSRYALAHEAQREPNPDWQSALLWDQEPLKVGPLGRPPGDLQKGAVPANLSQKFLSTLKASADDSEQLAKSLQLPLRRSEGAVLAQGEGELATLLASSSGEGLRRTLREATSESLFAAPGGVSIAEGLLWFTCPAPSACTSLSDVKVVHFNPR